MNIFFEWDEIKVRGSYSGVKKTTCPKCSHERRKKNDNCLYVNFESGVAKCYHCSALSFKEKNQVAPTQKNYVLPTQEWKNFTNLSDKLVKWIWETRNISQSTLNAFDISEELVYQPAKQKQMNSITFNYFEGELLVNKKFRSADKDFTQVKDGKPVFYNINSIIGQDEVYIVEGEFDVLAMYEAGIKNVISLPNGANDNDDYWINSEKYIKDIKKFIIATDNDEKGILVREKIAQRLGRYRCVYIEFKGKDANDDLMSGDLIKSIQNVQRFSIGGTFNSFDLLNETLRLYEKGLPDTIYPKNKCFGNIKDVFSIMMGQLTVITGIPSHGKSSFLDWYVLNLLNDYDFKASIYSPEHTPLELYNAKFIKLAVGKPFWGQGRVTEQEVFRYTEFTREKMYFTTGEAGLDNDWDWLLNKFKEQMLTYGINIFVIDAWNKVQMPKGFQGKDGIDRILTKITAFCIQYNVHIFLVAHPTKMSKGSDGLYEVPTLYDVSGSADFRNQTHNGFTIYRTFETVDNEGSTRFINQKTKFDFQGEIGSYIDYKYHKPSGRYYIEHSNPEFDMTRNEYEQSSLSLEVPVNFYEVSRNNNEFEDFNQMEDAPF